MRDMGDTFLEKMLVESYELKCKSNVSPYLNMFCLVMFGLFVS